MNEYDEMREINLQRDYKVVKANEIIQRARYDLSITELKAMAFIFSKIKPNDAVVGQWFQFSAKDYCQVCGIDYNSGSNYRAIKAALKHLRDTSFWLRKEDGSETTVGWLEKVNISPASGKISVRLDEDLAGFLKGLYSNYTQYELLSTLPMRSNYSFRIYELLKSYSGLKSYTFDIDELKSLLMAEKYVNFKDFRKKVLEIAVREINLYTDLEVSWRPVMKGRKVIQVYFDIQKRDVWGKLEAGQRARKALDGQLTLNDFDPSLPG